MAIKYERKELSMDTYDEVKELKLSPKEQTFVLTYLSNGFVATDAALAAGYKRTTARQQGHQLLKKKKIKEFIAKKIEELNKEKIAQVQDILEFWTEIMKDKQEFTTNRLKSSEYLAKYYQLFVEQIDMKIDRIEIKKPDDDIF